MKMAVTSNVNKNKFLSIAASVVLGLAAVIGLQACSSSGGGTPVVETQDASGLFKSGTANLNAGAVAPTDVRAFVHGGRIIAFSISSHILFDGQITNITGDDFTATVDLYETGEMTQADIAVTGKVTSQSQITGTLAGTGVGNGTFTLLFDNAYDTPADFVKVDNGGFEGKALTNYSFLTDVGTNPIDTIVIESNGDVLMDVVDSNPFTINCEFEGAATVPLVDKNLFGVTKDLKSTNAFNTSCVLTPLDPAIKFTGFMSQLSETGTDLDLIYAVTNGTYSSFGFLSAP